MPLYSRLISDVMTYLHVLDVNPLQLGKSGQQEDVVADNVIVTKREKRHFSLPDFDVMETLGK